MLKSSFFLPSKPLSIANTVPYEIWALITSYVPPSQRATLLPVSRYFLSIILSERYCEVRWTVLNKGMIRYLERLQDPFVAQYVQRLHIQAWFINFLVQRSLLFQKSITTNKASKELWSKVKMSLFSIVASKKSQARRMSMVSSKNKKDPSLMSPTQVLSLMINALTNMTNLTSYSFEWRDLPLDKNSAIFLTTAQNSIRRLQKLVLHAQISNFSHLLHFVDFECLQEVKFHFDYETNTDGLANGNAAEEDSNINTNGNIDVLENRIAPFINRFKLSLNRLTISSTSTTPLSTFFKSLGIFPNLQYLELDISFASPTLPNADPIIKFLSNNSSSLLHVKLIPPYQSNFLGNTSEEYQQFKSTRWSQMNLILLESPSNALSNLQTLYIPASVSLSSTITLLHRSTSTLTSLCLLQRYLTFQELKEFTRAFADRSLHSYLQHLKIEFESFNLKMLAQLAKGFPSLVSLVVVTEKNIYINSTLQTSHDPFVYSMFIGDPSLNIPPSVNTILKNWKLYDFAVYIERFREPQSISHTTYSSELLVSTTVKRFVPSIQYCQAKHIP